MQDQTQAQINSLKVRVFDAEEALRNERQSMTEFMQKLVDVIRPKADEQGGVTLEAIMVRAQELAQFEAEQVATAAAPDNVVPFTQPIAPEAG